MAHPAHVGHLAPRGPAHGARLHAGQPAGHDRGQRVGARPGRRPPAARAVGRLLTRPGQSATASCADASPVPGAASVASGPSSAGRHRRPPGSAAGSSSPAGAAAGRRAPGGTCSRSSAAATATTPVDPDAARASASSTVGGDLAEVAEHGQLRGVGLDQPVEHVEVVLGLLGVAVAAEVAEGGPGPAQGVAGLLAASRRRGGRPPCSGRTRPRRPCGRGRRRSPGRRRSARWRPRRGRRRAARPRGRSR